MLLRLFPTLKSGFRQHLARPDAGFRGRRHPRLAKGTCNVPSVTQVLIAKQKLGGFGREGLMSMAAQLGPSDDDFLQKKPTPSDGFADVHVDAVLQYWYKDLDLEQHKYPLQFWFSGGKDVDEEIRRKFELTLKLAASGHLESWKASPQGTLALVITLDQFSRNIFRGTPQAFAQDEATQKIVLEAIRKGWDRALGPFERSFLYTPLMHSENLEVHEHADRAFQALADDFKEDDILHNAMLDILKFERGHAAVLKKYGRYPSRNAILGRQDTPEEAEYNASGRAWS